MVGDIPDAAAAASVAGEEDNVPDFVLAGDEAAGAALAVVLDVQGTADVENGEASKASKADAAAAAELGEEGIGAGAFDGTVALCRHIVARAEAEDGGRGAVTQVAAAAAAVGADAVAALGSGLAGEERHAKAAGPVDGKEAAGAAEASARSHDEADIGDAAAAAAAVAVGAAAVVEGMVDKGYGWDCRRADDEGFGGVKVAVPSAEMDIAAAAVAAAEKVEFVEAWRARAYREGTPATMSLTPWRGAGRSPPIFRRAPSPRGAP